MEALGSGNIKSELNKVFYVRDIGEPIPKSQGYISMQANKFQESFEGFPFWNCSKTDAFT